MNFFINLMGYCCRDVLRNVIYITKVNYSICACICIVKTKTFNNLQTNALYTSDLY